jgi:2-polyprenyl-3-methyl-5-hydroxy-6-metoxy-1,4-benzoquinol methylase
MTSKVSWSRKRAIDVHDETARIFSEEYAGDNAYDSPFRYGRHLIDQAWARIVSELPKGAQCLDIGSGIGAYMARLLKAGFEVQGIEPSPEMRKLAAEHVPSSRVTDGSVLDLAAFRQSRDFIYAIEVFRYLDTNDNVVGHQEIFQALKPGGVYFGSYVNRWALDLYRQIVGLRRLKASLQGEAPRYHVEFETPSSLRKKLAAAGFRDIEIRGAMFAPLRPLHKVSASLATVIGRRTMPQEGWLSDHPLTRAFAGHLIATARR